MPNIDKTGPKGEGAKTGRGLGECSGKTTNNAGFGRRRGCKWSNGLGIGYGRRENSQNLTPDTKK